MSSAAVVRFRARTHSAHRFLDGLEDAAGSERRDQSDSAGFFLGPRIRQPGDGD
jgi:hypothetical protein